MLFKLYKLLWKVTNDRRWLLRYIDVLDEQIYNDILRWRYENGR